MTRSLITLADGRSVDLIELGDPAGVPVWVFHGTPGGPLAAASAVIDGVPDGVRVLCAGRPGSSRSTPVPGGSLRLVMDDLDELNTQLGIDRFAVLGISGGGPYAASAAAAYPEQVSGLAILAGVSPAALGTPPADFEAYAAALSLARRGRFEEATQELREICRSELIGIEDFGVPDFILAEILDGTEVSVDGAVFDTFAFYGGPWDIDVRSVGCPVWLWYGEADELVPAHQSRWYAENWPQARLVISPGADHGGAINPFKLEALGLLAETLRARAR